jgi:hypothetical protein
VNHARFDILGFVLGPTAFSARGLAKPAPFLLVFGLEDQHHCWWTLPNPNPNTQVKKQKTNKSERKKDLNNKC